MPVNIIARDLIAISALFAPSNSFSSCTNFLSGLFAPLLSLSLPLPLPPSGLEASFSGPAAPTSSFFFSSRLPAFEWTSFMRSMSTREKTKNHEMSSLIRAATMAYMSKLSRSDLETTFTIAFAFAAAAAAEAAAAAVAAEVSAAAAAAACSAMAVAWSMSEWLD